MRMNGKKLTALLGTAVLAMGILAGCGSGAGETSAAGTAAPATTAETSAEASDASGETKDTEAAKAENAPSADLSGTAGECSDTGCVINTSPFADGTSSSGDGGSMTVTYTEDTVFQKGTVKSDGSSYSLEDSEKDRIGDSDFVLCFGKQQADGSYLADRIIMIVFN